MEPIIYKFAKPDKAIKIPESNFIFDTEPSPKLIKYGFNQTTEKLDLITLFENPHYKNGLNFDFDRTDKTSIKEKCKNTFGSKIENYEKFCACWEILHLFKILNKNQTVMTDDSDIKMITQSHQKIFKSKTKIDFVGKKDKKSATLVIKTYSKIDLDENAYVHLLGADLSDLLSRQTTGSAMILQMFSTHTQIMAQIINYLSSLYNESYIIKPSVISDLSDEKYIVLVGLISATKFTYPKPKPNTFLSTIGILVPDTYDNNIQCMNSKLIPDKFKKYYEIKTYLDSKVFEGITYTEMIRKQDANTANWFDIFMDQNKMEVLLGSILEQTGTECDYVAKWNDLYS